MEKIKKGINLLFYSIILTIIASVFSGFTNNADPEATAVFNIPGFIGSLLTLVAGILALIGYFSAGEENDLFKKAAWFSIGEIIVSFAVSVFTIIGGVAGDTAIQTIYNVLQIASTILHILVVYFAVKGFKSVTKIEKTKDLAKNTWIVYLIAFVVIMICSIVIIAIGSVLEGQTEEALVTLLLVISALAFVAAVASLVSGIMYIVLVFKMRKEVNEPSFGPDSPSGPSDDGESMPFNPEY